MKLNQLTLNIVCGVTYPLLFMGEAGDMTLIGGWLTYPLDGIGIFELRMMFGFWNFSDIGVDVDIASVAVRIGEISFPVTGFMMKFYKF